MALKIGFDLDNTLLNYDGVFRDIAIGQGWLDQDAPTGKDKIKERLKKLDGGQLLWETAQALAYGPRLQNSVLNDGALECIIKLAHLGCELCIISHKTQFSLHDISRTDLRQAALKHLVHLGVTEIIPQEDIFFEESRALKVQRILDQHCNSFVDDLIETFEEPYFPKTCRQVWYSPANVSGNGHLKTCKSFKEVYLALTA